MRTLLVAAVTLVALVVAGCGSDDDDGDGGETPAASATSAAVNTPAASASGTPAASPPGASTTPGAAPATMALTSTAFSEGQRLPDEFTCTGANVSPPLAWDGAPAETRAYALIMDDPDTPRGTFDHWVAYDLPQDALQIERGQAADDIGGTRGQNGTGGDTYLGSCPPPGDGDHRYIFRIYALDAPLGLPPGADKQTVLDAMDGHVLAQGQLIGMYSRE
jgi:Raf kinase inhibitor-like YbhB/YbcL family protein